MEGNDPQLDEIGIPILSLAGEGVMLFHLLLGGKDG
jgi:hypothetical protein